MSVRRYYVDSHEKYFVIFQRCTVFAGYLFYAVFSFNIQLGSNLRNQLARLMLVQFENRILLIFQQMDFKYFFY